MRAEEFLRDKFDEHWKNGGSALNISAYAESKILVWMEEYKQLHQPTVSGAVPSYNICGGCGADHPSKRCINCRHDFGTER